MSGTKHSEATKEKMRLSAKKRIAEKPWTNQAGWNKGKKTGKIPPNYKAENVSYSGLHHWVKYHLGTAKDRLCVGCGYQAKEWANKSGQYKRELSDWQPMCIKCHRNMDNVGKKAWETRTKNGTRKWH